MVVKTTIRTPMPIKMRAKQFAMFDALKGLTDAVAEKERRQTPKKELAEGRIEEINQQLLLINKGDFVSVTYYCQHGKQYRQITGRIDKVDKYWKILQIGEVSIAFEAIFSISI